MKVEELNGVKGTSKILKVDPQCVVIRKDWNPRIDFGELEDLSRSIIENGLLVPIRIRQNSCGELEVIDGERRLKATLIAIKNGYDIKSVSAIYETVKNDSDLMVLTLVTNQGKPLTPLEEAVAFNRLKKMGLSVKDIARRIGKSNPYVYEKLILINADEEVKKALKNKEISVATAASIVGNSKSQKREQSELLHGVYLSVNYKKLSIHNKKLFENTFKKLSGYFQDKSEISSFLENMNTVVSAEEDPIFLYGKFKAMQEIFRLKEEDILEIYKKIKE